MRESITTNQFIISCIINGINTIFYFYSYPISFDYRQLVYLTIITLDLNCIYLFLSFICDFALFVFNSDKLENMNNFLRNKFCHIINPIQYTVTISFLVLLITGGVKGGFQDTLNTIFTIYAHIIITIFVIIDLFVADHKRHYFSRVIFRIIIVYAILYLILECIATFGFDSPPYLFIENIKWWAFILYIILISIILVLSYLLHIFLFKIKYEYILKIKDTPQNYIEEVNKVIQMTDNIPEN